MDKMPSYPCPANSPMVRLRAATTFEEFRDAQIAFNENMISHYDAGVKAYAVLARAAGIVGRMPQCWRSWLSAWGKDMEDPVAVVVDEIAP